MKYNNLQKGSSLYLTVMFMVMILGVAAGVSILVVSGSNLMKGMGDSVRAFQVADSAIEETLYRINAVDRDSQNGFVEGLKSNGVDFTNSFSTDYAEKASCEILVEDGTDGGTRINAHGFFNGSSRIESVSF
jgi:Tfp pilus assembly protein PilX